MRYVKHEKVKGQYLITVDETSSWYLVYCWTGKIYKKYIGEGTVWHTYPDFKRAETSKEYQLSEIFAKVKHNE